MTQEEKALAWDSPGELFDHVDDVGLFRWANYPGDREWMLEANGPKGLRKEYGAATLVKVVAAALEDWRKSNGGQPAPG